MPRTLELRTSDAGPAGVASRAGNRPVVLVGFQNQGNLGLGYLAATLRAHGHRVETLDFEKPVTELLHAVRALDPSVIGFSLIFQSYVRRFAEVIRHLRGEGVRCHLTMGGHFPTLSYAEVFREVPGLDSIVRFEGEFTLLELVDALNRRGDWRHVRGIAYLADGRAVATPLRPLIDDLDRLPYPERNYEAPKVLGHAMMPLIASRGCARTCSFCSIHTFYRAAPGRVVRTRMPAEVVREMRSLHEDRGVTIFLFQDDDFPLFGRVWRAWADAFVNELWRSGLVGRVIWKINCRADVVERELFSRMQAAGLYLVYMGLESGSGEGLQALNKGITVRQNLHAVQLLKGMNLAFEFGFMLFDPSSTLESVRVNLDFLRAIVGDGSTAATFCRMLPYDGTPIKDELARSGRLRGDVCNPSYEFVDPKVEDFYRELMTVVDIEGWIRGYEGLSLQLSWAWHEVAVLDRLFPPLSGMSQYKEILRGITTRSNRFLLQVLEDLSFLFSHGRAHGWSADIVEQQRKSFTKALRDERDAFVCANERCLLEALGQAVPPAPGGAVPV